MVVFRSNLSSSLLNVFLGPLVLLHSLFKGVWGEGGELFHSARGACPIRWLERADGRVRERSETSDMMSASEGGGGS